MSRHRLGPRTRAIVVMGVSGCGKSTIGALLAQRLGWRFADADGFHPPANVEKMRSGLPLSDHDRFPWLERLNALMRHSIAKNEPIVLACSALKEQYRGMLQARLPELAFVFLQGSRETIAARLGTRRHEYMPASLLDSQFATLEPPTQAFAVDIDATPETIVSAVLGEMRR